MTARRPRAARGDTDPLIWVTEDTTRVVALVTGRGILATLTNAGLRPHARWSEAGHGWCIPSDDVPDLVAWCQWQSIPCRCRTLPAPEAQR